jgi:type I restriction enzyme M protein
MLRIGTMNMLLHGVDHPDIRPGNALSTDANPARGRYSLVLANPPFAGSHDPSEVARDVKGVTNTKKTELLFVSLFLQQLQLGGRCCCVVPAGVLFGASTAHKDLRKALVDGHRLDAVIALPSGVFKPYSGVSTALVLLTRTDSGGTDDRGVFFYDVEADGYSLDDKRDPIDANDLPDVVKQWNASASATADADPLRDGSRTAKCFRVPAAEIRENGYDLSVSRYRKVDRQTVKHDAPVVILDRLDALEAEIMGDLKALREMVA